MTLGRSNIDLQFGEAVRDLRLEEQDRTRVTTNASRDEILI